MDVQFQIRQNAMEMQEYMKDLFDWQKSIKKKERTMAINSVAGSQHAPAPRGRASGAVAPAPASLMSPVLGPKGAACPSSSATQSVPAYGSQNGPVGEDAPTKKNAAAHTYSSYHKWDKFDVDAALASDDEADWKPSASISHNQPVDKATVKPATYSSSSSSSSATPGNKASSGHGDKASPQAADAAAAAAVGRPPPQPAGIQITARGPHDTLGPQEDLLRPVATTRLAVDSAARSGGGAAGAAAAPSQPAAAALPPIRNSQPTTPDAWRARGNELFKAGEYDSAYECYSRSVELQPTCLAHANRAMALLRLGRWREAVEDCTAAIQLDPTYVKAFQRRAAAHRQLGAIEDAAQDWEQALRLEPDNRATAADRDATLEQLMAQQKLQPPSRRVAVQVSCPAAPPAAAGASRGGGVRAAAAAPRTGAGAVGGRTEQDAVDAAAARSQGEGQAATAGAGASVPPPPALQAETLGSASAPEFSSTTSTPVQAAAVRDGPGTATPALAATGPDRASASAALAGAAAAAAAAASAAAMRGVPRTSVEFEAAWRSLAGDGGRRAAYLAAIPPARLPAVFKNSLTAPVLSAVLRCLLEACMVAGPEAGDRVQAEEAAVSPRQVLALLEGMTRVARFDLMAMSVPAREREELRAAWEALEGALTRPAGLGMDISAGQEAEAVAGGLAALRPKYRL